MEGHIHQGGYLGYTPGRVPRLYTTWVYTSLPYPPGYTLRIIRSLPGMVTAVCGTVAKSEDGSGLRKENNKVKRGLSALLGLKSVMKVIPFCAELLLFPG